MIITTLSVTQVHSPPLVIADWIPTATQHMLVESRKCMYAQPFILGLDAIERWLFCINNVQHAYIFGSNNPP